MIESRSEIRTTNAGNVSPVLSVRDLSIGFQGEDGMVGITDRISFELRPGEILGIAGESGSGKTVTALALLRLLPQPDGAVLGGSVRFQDQEILNMSHTELRAMRGAGISMIFQEPSSAMNPLMTVRRQLNEVFEYHEFDGKPETRINDLMHRVGFADAARILDSYPHQLSGGMLQRVMIAMALLLHPSVIIADEPTTALDVTVQAQIMELLVQLQKEEGAAVILITHNLGLIAQYADRLAIMYAGRIVEEAPIESFLKDPLHPYSEGLINALPDLSRPRSDLQPIRGQVPRPIDFPAGCRFRARCDHAFDPCDKQPELTLPSNSSVDDKHRVACFLHHSEVVR